MGDGRVGDGGCGAKKMEPEKLEVEMELE